MATSVAQENPPFAGPEDQEQKNIIDKLANFVARNGGKFEEMTKEKQKGNKKFSFLFGGEYYNYYKWRVSVEIAQSQTQQHKQNAQQLKKQGLQGPTPQYSANPQAAIIQQAIVQQSINSAPWQQAQQQAQQQMQTLQQQQQPAPPYGFSTTQAAQPQPADLNLPEFEILLQKIMESCTKDSISSGKSWIISNNKSPQHSYHVAQYLLRRALTPGMQFQHKLHIIYLINDLTHHCARKSAPELQKSIQDVVVPVFVHTHLGEPPENQQKLAKVLNIWESNKLFEGSHILQMKNPESSQGAVQAAIQQQGFTSQYNYQQPAPVSGSEPQQYQHYQQFQQYYQQYPVYQQPPQQYQQPPPETRPPPQGQFQHSAPESQSEQGKSDDKDLQEDNKDGKLPDNTHGDSQKSSEENTEISSKGKENLRQQEEEHKRDENAAGPREEMQHGGYHSEPYQDYHYEDRPPFHGPPPPFRDYAPFPHPPFPPPDFSHPPPTYNQMPPGFPEGGFGYRGPPPPFPRPRGPPEEYDYRHQRPGFANRGPPVVNDYNHGMADESYGEDYEEPPPPGPIIPNAMYYELPAGLMAPLVQISDVDYKPIDPTDLRLPAPQPPSERLLAAVEAFYSPPSHERPRNSEGWEQSGLFEFYKAKLPYIKERDARAKQNPAETGAMTSRSRSRSRSPAMSPRPRSRSPSPRRRKSRSRSLSPRKRRSRSRSYSPPRKKRSRSRSRSISPFFTRQPVERSPSPPAYMPSFMPKTLDTRIEESNVGHMLLKKMGWEGAGLGKSEQGIQNPIAGGEVRDKFSKYKGVGVALKGDVFEEFRKNRSYTYNRPSSSKAPPEGD